METVEDITENAAAEARIMSAAETDALTGLGNRLAFNKILDRVVRGASYGSRGFSLILVDLNNFKSLNDTYGHHIGDRVLQETAHVLKQTCRAEDFAARLGGDEFAVIIKSPQPGSVEYLARRLSKQFARPMCIGDLNLQSGAAIGIAPIEPGSSAEEVLVNADAAMYKAKSENLNQYKVFDNIIAAELRGMRRLQAELATVIGEEKLETHFQPVIDLGSGELSGAEALVRWRKDDGSFVTPATFVPLAEDVGMIREIGSQVLWASIRAAAGWPDHMTVSVNVSPKQLGTGEFLNQVLECLREHDLDAKRLELEVTENVLMDKESAALAELLEFKKHGVRIALDDFGTGYSSLSYLHHFSFDKLKIDRAFVMPMERDQTCAALVYTILNLCQNLGLDCTAEGIETEHQRRLLTVAGCNYGQGYQFYRPMPETEFNQIISEAYPLFAKDAIAVGQV
ncbi:putative bifunctional diguanylate cyclase/phosphodiesterase [Roseibium sp.]|uniref:putative bifunctional diguanylate cyclase/phosphodiesterase n=1 Tax=Roseibium sp. TaxID=1936156 RepID=UPI003B52A857